ncbi:MAG: HD domain-containing protein, partial [Burkholderiaceae bacterium]
MVSTAALQSEATAQIGAGLDEHDRAMLGDALDLARGAYAGQIVATGQDAFAFATGVAATLALLNTDTETRLSGLLFEMPVVAPKLAESIEARFGKECADLIANVRQLMRLYEITFGRAAEAGRSKDAAAQVETLRKMLLAMASDMRAVLVRLASRLITLRYFADNRIENEAAYHYASETFDLYAPLANRLGVWQLKWELEDLAFRFLEPDAYKRIARMLEEKRVERETFVEHAIARLREAL